MPRTFRERPFTVMLSPFAWLRVNPAKHLASLFVGGEVQSEILRSAQNDSMADECMHGTLSSVVNPFAKQSIYAPTLGSERLPWGTPYLFPFGRV